MMVREESTVYSNVPWSLKNHN
uniref:Uncharacterized protein n=1 Tax=Amphimedon queenslandica TaxID=400682 RepID=A0A1X7VD29_AMPQE